MKHLATSLTVAALLLLAHSVPSQAYCVYNTGSVNTIHVNVSGSQNLDTDIKPGESACCPGGVDGCSAALATITLVGDSDVECALDITVHGWINASLSEADIDCQSFGADSTFLKNLLREAQNREKAGTAKKPY